MTEKRQRASDVKVGLFVALGILATFLSLFIVGQERRLWERTADLRAQFSNVGGLKVGGAVRLSGVNIGIVSRIDLPAVDPQADSRLVAPLAIADLKLDEGNAGEVVDIDGAKLKRARCTKTIGCISLPLVAQKMPHPTPLSVLVKDPDQKLEVIVRVIGTNLNGETSDEDIIVRLRNSSEAVVVGKIYFTQVDSVAITILKDNEVPIEAGATIEERRKVGPTLQVGDGTARKLNVVMRVSEKFLERIRSDSQASVVAEGLLGDKYIDISIGSTSKLQLQDGDLILSNDAVDFTAALASAGEIIDNVNASTESIRGLLEGFRKAGGEATVVAAMNSIQDIATEVQKGEGLIHQLIFDKKAGTAYKDIVGNVKTSSEQLNANLAKIDGILADVKTNDSLVHELLYGKSGEATVQDARKLIAEATQVVTDVRTQPSFVHNLLYEKDRGEILANANAASADLKAITADVRTIVAETKGGKGTLGRLIVDPSVYEDLKILLGNVRRNDAVKALVRYSIEQEEKKAAEPPKK